MKKNNKLPRAMKSTLTKPLALSFGLAVAGIFSHPAQAATITKANNTDNLNLATSWRGGVVPAAADIALWDSTVTGPNSVSLGADLSWQGLAIANPGGAVTLGAGNTLTTGSAGIDMSAATQDLTINSGLALLSNAGQTWNVASGRTLTLNPGTFTRGAGATLNLQGAGTIATTTIANVNGIVGPWATIGSDTSLSYATVSAGSIIALTGSGSFTTGSTSTTANLDLTANVNLTSGSGSRSANTIRNTGAFTITVGTNRHLQLTGGLLNAGTGALTIAQTGTGVLNPLSTELVFATNTQALTVNAPIPNQNFNAGGATTLTISSQGGTVTLTPTGTGSGVSNASTYSGGTSLNSGILSLGRDGALGAGALTMAGGTTLTATAARTITNNITLNGAATFTPGSGTAFAVNGIISGSGSLTKTGASGDTLTLGGANNYTGATTVSAGMLVVSASGALGIGNVVVADLVGSALTLANNNAIADSAILNFGNNSTINLNAASGTSETIAGLVDSTTGAIFNTPGTYDAATLNARFGGITTFVSSLGETITIAAVPEPSAWMMVAFGTGLLCLGGRIARRKNSHPVRGT